MKRQKYTLHNLPLLDFEPRDTRWQRLSLYSNTILKRSGSQTAKSKAWASEQRRLNSSCQGRTFLWGPWSTHGRDHRCSTPAGGLNLLVVVGIYGPTNQCLVAPATLNFLRYRRDRFAVALLVGGYSWASTHFDDLPVTARVPSCAISTSPQAARHLADFLDTSFAYCRTIPNHG